MHSVWVKGVANKRNREWGSERMNKLTVGQAHRSRSERKKKNVGKVGHGTKAAMWRNQWITEPISECDGKRSSRSDGWPIASGTGLQSLNATSPKVIWGQRSTAPPTCTINIHPCRPARSKSGLSANSLNKYWEWGVLFCFYSHQTLTHFLHNKKIFFLAAKVASLKSSNTLTSKAGPHFSSSTYHWIHWPASWRTSLHFFSICLRYWECLFSCRLCPR